jgi:hypothetical protein
MASTQDGRNVDIPAQSIEYDVHSMRDIKAEISTDQKTGKKKIESVTIGGRPVRTSQRFWNSLYSKFGFSGSFFNYFSPAEVFERVADKRPDERLRITFQNEPEAPMSSVLAVSNPSKAHLPYQDVIDLLLQGNPQGDVTFADGVLRASYAPRGEAKFTIGGDEFEARFDTLVPIDGYGNPSTVLGTYRLVCANGLVALSQLFSNKIPTGSKDTDGGLARIIQTLESYGNDEGYSALRSRMENARMSYASVAECQMMSKATFKAMGGGIALTQDRDALKEMLESFDRLTGNFVTMYGLVNENAIGRKRLSSLPSRATVYDLMNFGTEIATHYVPSEVQRRSIQGVVGEMLAREYDLEGSAKDGRDFIDVFIDADNETSTSRKTREIDDNMTNENFSDE